MNVTSNPLIKEPQQPASRFPAVSIILPFEPKMTQRVMLSQLLKSTRNKVEKLLFENYPADMAALVMEKLLGIFKRVDFSTHKKSIVMYVSPAIEKVLYLNMATEEHISVNDSFNIKDLLNHRKESHEYNVLVLAQNRSALFAINKERVRKIFSSTPALAKEYTDSMVLYGREHSGIAFLRYTDNVLDNILNVYPYPFFILGEREVVDQFKQISRHKNAVIEYIFSDDASTDPVIIADILGPYVENAKLLNQKKLMARLKTAQEQGKLITGFQEVLQGVMAYRGSVLIIDKDFICPYQGRNSKVVFMKPRIVNKFSYIKDSLGFIIEKVLENGGHVETADKDSLKNHQHIALIK